MTTHPTDIWSGVTRGDMEIRRRKRKKRKSGVDINLKMKRSKRCEKESEKWLSIW